MTKRNHLTEWAGNLFLDWLWYRNTLPPTAVNKLWQQHTQDALRRNLAFQLTKRRHDYERDGNPLALIEAFLLAVDANEPPPTWCLAGLRSGFDAWHAALGTQTLDGCLGLTPKRRSQPFRKELESRRDGALCFEIFTLQSIVRRMSVIDAARLVADSYTVDDPNVSMLWRSTLKRTYDTVWRKRFENDPTMQRLRESYQDWNDDQRRNHLRVYYRDLQGEKGSNSIIDKYLTPSRIRPCLRCDAPIGKNSRARVCPACRTRNAAISVNL